MTDTISFDQEPLVPPVILDSRTGRTPIGEEILVDQQDEGTEWTMEVQVVEKDVDRKLWGRFRIVHPPLDRMNPPQFEERVVPTGGVDPERRDFIFKVRKDLLSPLECHRLELVVSGSFDRDDDAQGPGFFAYVLDNKDDIAWAKWPVWEGSQTRNDPEVLFKSCHAMELMESAGPVANEEMP